VAPIFVGRKDESDRLVQGLSDSLGGRGRLFLITGNAGVGKTRLADEIAELALGRGALVLRGGSFEDVSAPSYWPWTQVLRTILQSKDHLTALPASARAATSVLGLIPELRAELKSHLAPDAIPEGTIPASVKLSLIFGLSDCSTRLPRFSEEWRPERPCFLCSMIFIASIGIPCCY